MKKILSICIITLVLLLSGCGNKKIFVGSWDYYDGEKSRNDISYVFNKDKTGKYTFFGDVKEFTYEFDDKYLKIKLGNKSGVNKFEYSISDNVLTLKDSSGNDSMYKKR